MNLHKDAWNPPTASATKYMAASLHEEGGSIHNSGRGKGKDVSRNLGPPADGGRDDRRFLPPCVFKRWRPCLLRDNPHFLLPPAAAGHNALVPRPGLATPLRRRIRASLGEPP